VLHGARLVALGEAVLKMSLPPCWIATVAAGEVEHRHEALAKIAAESVEIATAAPTTSAHQALPEVLERRVALVIGNGAYRSAPGLVNPVNDATDMAAALRGLGFDVVEGTNLDRRGMDDAVRAFGRKLDRTDLALFFYAGHGLQVAGKNYLVPIDARLERAGNVNFDAIDLSFVLAQMEAVKRVNLVFLDACRDNPLARSLGTRSASVGQDSPPSTARWGR